VWEVVVRRELRSLIDGLKGKGAGYRQLERELERDPCQVFAWPDRRPRPLAYRLTGDLQPKVCGAHLKRDYRLAFTMRPPDREGIEGIVEILFVGRRDTRRRANDTWTIIHDLFGVENPSSDHQRPPCCDDGHPEMPEDEIREFMRRLSRFLG
jgi:hypothetical protein